MFALKMFPYTVTGNFPKREKKNQMGWGGVHCAYFQDKLH